jgi:heat shock protein HtpX
MRMPGRVRFSEERRLGARLRNALHTILLLGGMVVILTVCGWAIWGPAALVWVPLTVGVALWLAPEVAPDWVMRIYGAQALRPADFPDGYALLAELARRAGLPAVPRLHLIRSPLLNAFAVGRREAAAIAVTAGLLRSLTARELAGVLAHEIAHIKNGDLRIMGLADLAARLTSLMSWLGQLLLLLNLPLILAGAAPVPWLVVIVLILAPTFIALLQLALSRSREYQADLEGAALTRDPAGIAAALRKLDRRQGHYWEEILLPGRRIPEPSLLRTHPPTEERIRRLLALYEPHGPALPDDRPLAPPAFVVGPLPRPHFHRWGAWY